MKARLRAHAARAGLAVRAARAVLGSRAWLDHPGARLDVPHLAEPVNQARRAWWPEAEELGPVRNQVGYALLAERGDAALRTSSPSPPSSPRRPRPIPFFSETWEPRS